MNNFEKVTESPEALGAFLASLSGATGPWDEEFHARFCTGCAATCDVCPHAEERNNPLWWLRLGEKQGEAAEVTIKIKAAFHIEAADFHDMVRRYYGERTKVYDDYKAAAAEVKRLNAAERERQEAGQ